MFEKNLSLCDGWKFALVESANVDELISDNADETLFNSVKLPHDWAIRSKRSKDNLRSQGFFDRSGDGWYRFKFDAPECYSQDKKVYIIFDGVENFSTVWLNGEKIGGHAYGTIVFECKAKSLRKTNNLLVVRVEAGNAENSDRWYTGSGIIRNVKLVIKNEVHILPDGVKLAYKLNDTLNEANLKLKLRLSNTTDKSQKATVNLKLKDPFNKTVFFNKEVSIPTGESEACAEFNLKDISLWDIDSPLLYKAEVSLNTDTEIDKTSFNVGFRESHFEDETGYYLNGRNLKIYGVSVHSDCGVFGSCGSPKLWRRRLNSFKEMGCNTIRCAHNMNIPEFYDICDEIGLLVVDELYDKWLGMYYKKFFVTDRITDLNALINRDFNHPSIILWSVGNELDIQFREDFYEYTKEMVDECHRLDPDRPASLALIGYCRGEDLNNPEVLNDVLEKTVRYSELVDVNMMNYMEPFFELLRKKGLKKCILASEVFGHYSYYDNVENSFAFYPASVFAGFDKKPYVAGGLVWSGVDYLGSASAWPASAQAVGDVYSSGTRKLNSYHLEGQFKSVEKEPMIKIGIYDDSLPFNMARDRWGALPICETWGCSDDRLISVKHIAVMTNCEEAELIICNEEVCDLKMDEAALRQEASRGRVYRTGKLPRNPEDRIVHFWVGAARGTLTAVGYHNGEPVAEQTLYFTDEPQKLSIIPDKTPLNPDGRDVTFVEIELQDKEGQRWERPVNGEIMPEIKVEVSGAADFYALDSGNHTLAETDFFSPNGRLNLGRTTLVLISNGKSGEVTVKATCGDFENTLTFKIL